MTELYLNGVKIALKQGETIATTIQANDLTKPDSVQSSYTNTFEVVATTETRAALGLADELASDSDIPYTVLDAELIADGRDILPFGLAEIVDSEKPFFHVSVYSGNVSFFDALGDKLLNELDLTEFDHLWTFDNVSANTANRANFIYDVMDRGKWMAYSAINWQDLLPSVFGKMLLDKIVFQAGFTYTGLNSDLMNKMLIPALKPLEYPQEFLDTITTFAGTTAGERIKQSFFEERAYMDADSVWGYTDGSEDCYSPSAKVYIAKYPCIVNTEARLMASIGCNYGTVSFRLSIKKNGTEIAYDKKNFKWSFAGQNMQPLNTIYQCSANNIYLNAGDYLEVRIEFKDETTLTGATYPYCTVSYSSNYPQANIYNQGQDYFKITPLKTFPNGGIIKLNNILPEMKQRDFVKFCLQLHNGVCQSDLFENKINLSEFRSIETNTANAFDWSEKFVSEKTLNYRFGDFAQTNWIKYKEDETVTAGYGNGKIMCGNSNLPKEATIIELPFSASLQSDDTLPLVDIPIYKWAGSSFQAQKLNPRVLLQGSETLTYTLAWAVPSGFIENGVTYKVLNYNKVIYDGTTYTSGQTFVANANRYYDAEGLGHVLDLRYGNQITAPITYFERQGQIPSLHFQNYIIPNYYSSLSGILNKVKYLKAWMRLTAYDIANYDATIPVWIEHFQHYFYVNKITEFQAGKLTEVELIRL